MSSGVLVIDTGCRVITMNAAAEEILELRKDDVVSQHLDNALGRRAAGLAHELVESLALERPRRRQEVAVHTRAGAFRRSGSAFRPSRTEPSAAAE